MVLSLLGVLAVTAGLGLATGIAGWRLVPAALPFGPIARFAWSGLLGWGAWSLFADWFLRGFGAGLATFALLPVGVAIALGWWAQRGAAATDRHGQAAHPDVTLPQAAAALAVSLALMVQVWPVEVPGGLAWGFPRLDWAFRLATLSAIARDGVPAESMVFNPFGGSKTFYYYGFYLPTACAVRFCDASPLVTLTGAATLIAWQALTVAMSLAVAFTGRSRSAWVALALLFVGGLDFLPVAWLPRESTWPGPVDWWNEGQVTILSTMAVWVPHHALAAAQVVAVTVAFGAAARWREAVPLAVAMAGMSVTSTYVAIPGFLGMLLVAAARCAGDWPAGRRALLIVVLGAALAVPFYWHLSSLNLHSKSDIVLSLRPFACEKDAIPWTTERLGLEPGAAKLAYRAAALPVQYALEFGFYLFPLVWWLRRPAVLPASRDLVAMAAGCLLVGTFLVSERTRVHDLSWRAMAPLQWILLPVGAAYLVRVRPTNGMRLALAVGVLTCVTDMAWNRGWQAIDYATIDQLKLAARARQASAVLNAALPHDTRAQYRIDRNPYWLCELRLQPACCDHDFYTGGMGPETKPLRDAVYEDMWDLFDLPTTWERRRELAAKYRLAVLIFEDRLAAEADAPPPTWSGEGWKAFDLRHP